MTTLIACPKCGAELHYDIASGSLLCPFCGGSEAPEALSSFGRSAEEQSYVSAASGEMDVILYSCPQCGGSIYSTDESVNGFCSYCGSNVMLSSRMAKMKYPRFIAPFKIDKEGCKQRYLNHVKNSFFIPKELKDPAFLDRFRGIYMTYWGYDVEVSGFISLDGKKESHNGLYVETADYKCRGWLKTEYKGIFYDASSSFEDHYSERIAPFDYNALVEFSPAYLSGFYADMPDLAKTVYEDNALAICKDNVFKSVQLHKTFPSLKFAEAQKENFASAMDSELKASYTTFFPVWFLSYRKKDRVAYAVVNGQTGRMISDMPVDEKKFLLAGSLLAIPIFILMCVLPAMPLNSMMIAGDFFSLFSIWLLTYMEKKVYDRLYMSYDKGYLSKHDSLNYKYLLKHEADRDWTKKGKEGKLWIAIICALIAIPFFLKFLAKMALLNMIMGSILINILIILTGSACSYKILQMAEKGRWVLIGGIALMILTSLQGTRLCLAGSASPIAYYIAISMMMTGNLIAQLTVMEQYNLLSTRPLHQLDRKGGTDHAWD